MYLGESKKSFPLITSRANQITTIILIDEGEFRFKTPKQSKYFSEMYSLELAPLTRSPLNYDRFMSENWDV